MTIEWIAQSTVLISTFLLIRAIFKNRLHPTLSYALWLVVAVRLLLPVHVGQISFGVAGIVDSLTSYSAPAQSDRLNFTQTVDSNSENSKNSDSIRQNRETSEPNLKNILKAGWAAGSVSTFCFFVTQKLVFYRKLKRSRNFLFDYCGKHPVFSTNAIDTPCMIGFLKPEIYITNEVEANETQFRHALLHEETHILHGDHIWSFVRCLCLSLH